MIQKQDLPERWNKLLENYLEDRPYLEAKDFKLKSVSIAFEDASFLRFNSIFYITSDEYDEIAIFTEHCGYYVFSVNSVEKINFEHHNPKPESILQLKIQDLCKDKPYFIDFNLGRVDGVGSDKTTTIYIWCDTFEVLGAASNVVINYTDWIPSTLGVSKANKLITFGIPEWVSLQDTVRVISENLLT